MEENPAANITELIEYYERLGSTPTGKIPPFLVCHAPIPYRNAPCYLKLLNYDTTERLPSSWEVVDKLAEPYLGRNHLPIKALNLETNEEFLAFRAKKRPCIPIAFTERKAFQEDGVRAKGFCDPVAIVVPLTTFYDSGGRLKPYLTKGFYWKVATFRYPQFMYFPHGGVLSLDGFAQFDRLCPVPYQQIEPTRTLLSEDARDLLMACLRAFLNRGTFSGDDTTWGKIVAEDLQPQFREAMKASKTDL